MINWVTKKIFKRDVEYVTVFLKFLIQCIRRRLEKIQQGQFQANEASNILQSL